MSALTRGIGKGPFAVGSGMDIGGQKDGSLHVREQRQAGSGRQTGTHQDLGSRPEEAAIKDLLLSASWQARTIRAANHTVYNLCNWRGLRENSRPPNSGWISTRGLQTPPQKENRREIGLEPRRTGQKVSGGPDRRIKPKNRDPPPEGDSEKLSPPPQGHTARWPAEQGWNGLW